MSTRREQTIGAGAQIVTEVSINFGSSLAGLAIPLVGSPVVVAVRQVVMLIVLLPFYQPKLAHLAWRRIWPAVLLGVVLVKWRKSY